MSLFRDMFWPTLIWHATTPDEEKSILIGMKDHVLNIKENEPTGVKKTNYGVVACQMRVGQNISRNNDIM